MTDIFTRPPIPEGPTRQTRSAHRARRAALARRRRRRRTTAIVVLLSLLAVGGVGAWVYTQSDGLFGFSSPLQAKDYTGPGVEPVDVIIEPGSTGTEMGRTLVDAGVVASVKAFVSAYEKNPKAASIQPGTHAMLTKMSAKDAVARLLAPDSMVQTKLTIPEGNTVAQIIKRAASVTGIPAADFEAAMADTAATGLPAEAKGKYEGWLFPTTYVLEPDDSAATIIKRMVNQTVLELDAAGVAPADRERVLTIASLIEREAKHDEDRPKMARAIFNRLDSDMMLQIDAAIAYGAGKSGMDLTSADLKDAGNPYNLRVHKGLPPTPIASPGRPSIDAVLKPADGPWKFWCTVNLETGETRFAENYDEHLANVALLKQWMADHPE